METARIDTLESCGREGRMQELSTLRSTKQRPEVGGAERNRTADEGFADPCLTTWLPRHPGLHATNTPQNEKPTCQVFRRWAAIPWG